MPVRRAAALRRPVLLVLVAALLAPLAAAPAGAGAQDRAGLSRVQRKPERVRRVLGDARADAA